MNLNRRQYCSARLLGLAILAMFVCRSQAVRGDLVIDLPELTVFSDNVNSVPGLLEVFLTLTGTDLTTPPMVSSFNLDFSTSGSGLTFSAAQAATTTPLFAGGVFGSFGTSSNVLAAHDVFPSSVTAFNNAGIIRVPFSVAGGNVGTTYTLIWNEALTQISNQLAVPLPVTLVGGSITVAAIPEAAAWQSLLFVALICAGAAYFYRRLRCSPVSRSSIG